MNLKISIYNEKDFNIFKDLFREYTDELRLNECDVARFNKEYNTYILWVDNIAVGFCSYAIRDMFGMVGKHISLDFIYIKEEYRKTKVSYYFYIQIGSICEDNDMGCMIYPLENSMSKMFRKMGAKKWDAYFIEKDVMIARKNKIMEKM